MLRHIPASSHPDLLVGFETSDDAGVFRLPGGQALVQTVDFFTPIVDDPYDYGRIAAANSLSDVYAMGGQPLTVLNIACFDPARAPADVWAAVFKGMADKVAESGAVILGGHSVVDDEPKFGCAVTGLVDADRMFANTAAQPGDRIFLSKPLGTGIITTAAKNDLATEEQLREAVESMTGLNKRAAEVGLLNGLKCATDITGFGLAGHLFNVARASKVSIEIDTAALPLLSGLKSLIEKGQTTGGGDRNREFVGEALEFASSVEDWMKAVIIDPQTSGGLALFSKQPLNEYVEIGQVRAGEPKLLFV